MNGPTFNVPHSIRYGVSLQASRMASELLVINSARLYWWDIWHSSRRYSLILCCDDGCHVASESHYCIICGVLILVVFTPCLFLHDPDEFMTERLLRTLLYFFSIELDNLFIF